MTLPYERTSAVLRAHEFLKTLAHPYDGFKRIPKDVRREALSILRHYPWPCEMTRLDNEVFSPSPEAHWKCNRSSTSDS